MGREALARLIRAMKPTSVPDYDVLPSVAREAISAHLERREPHGLPAPTGALRVPAPVFVTLRERGQLRGCIGSLEPICGDLVREVADRAVAAAFQDPRFPPLTADELPRCTIEVSVLGPLEPVRSFDELDARSYGVEVADATGLRGVLLPGIEGVDTVDAQLAIARRKAGIPAGAPVSVRRFEVVRIAEH